MPETTATFEENRTIQAQNSYGFVVLNPASGEGNPDKVRSQLRSALGEDSYDLHETAVNENLRQVVQTAVRDHDYDWVAAVGGDGTISQVADGLVGTDVPLLIIPAGTGNVLARTLELPEQLDAAASVVREPHTMRELDGIQLGEHYFFLQVGIGLESVTMEKTSSNQKNRWGLAAYLWTAVKEAFGWQPFHLTLTIDGTPHQLSVTELVIANASKIGVGSLEWDEQIYPDDGRIDIAVTSARSLGDYLQLITDLVRGTQRKSRKIQFFAATESIRLDAAESLPLHGDGEKLAQKLPLDMRVIPGALKVIVPA